jgi:hypothetical protein
MRSSTSARRHRGAPSAHADRATCGCTCYGCSVMAARRLAPCAALLASFFTIDVARADGIPSYLDRGQWHLLPEQAQQAVISLRDGEQTMILQVGLNPTSTPATADKLVWVTPIPAPAYQVAVDVQRGFPRFSGAEPLPQVVSAARAALMLMAASQAYPVPVVFALLTLRSRGHSGTGGLTVHRRLLKDGVEIEVASAGSSADIEGGLGQRGLVLPRSGLRALAPYASDGACLVVYRIADLKAYRRASEQASVRALGIEVRFPSAEGFFPLVASSALPGANIEVRVTVLGLMEAIDPTPPGLTSTHYLGVMDADPRLRQALGVSPDARAQLSYTRFRLSEAPRRLVHDLHFRSGASASTHIAASLLTSGHFATALGAAAVFVFLLLSAAASLVGRLAWPADTRPDHLTAAVIGLANCATLVGLFVAAWIVARRRGIAPRQVRGFVLCTSGAFCLFLLLLGLSTSLL